MSHDESKVGNKRRCFLLWLQEFSLEPQTMIYCMYTISFHDTTSQILGDNVALGAWKDDDFLDWRIIFFEMICIGGFTLI